MLNIEYIIINSINNILTFRFTVRLKGNCEVVINSWSNCQSIEFRMLNNQWAEYKFFINLIHDTDFSLILLEFHSMMFREAEYKWNFKFDL